MTKQVLALTSFMALLGLWAFSFAADAGVPFIVLLGALYGIGLLLSYRKKLNIPPLALNLVAAVVFLAFLADYLTFSREIITSGTRLLAVLLGLKLLSLRKGSDFLLAYALVFFQILAAAVSTVNLAFFAMLALYVMASIWAMILFSIERDMVEAAYRKDPSASVFGPRFFVVLAVTSALALFITLALFFSIPRVGVGIFQRKALNTVKTTGFSDTVDLGSLGPVKEDSTIVMRAEFTGGRPERTVYFKGATLEDYDGSAWKRERSPSFIKRAGPEGFIIGPGQGKSVEVAILLEPLDTEVLFTAPNVYRLEGSFPAIWAERTGVIRLPSVPFSRVDYRLWSDLSRVNADERAPKGPVNSRYLDESPEGQRIRELAALVSSGKTAFERASSIEAHLRANYKYDLSPRATPGKSALEDFLFYSKEGYCEHYATAMVMLLRASNIPSRLVTGFLEGEWNELGGYFIVRQKDAHSWVEAYIDGVGWTRFDPTPSAPAPPYRASALSLYLDLLRLKWNRHIIQFSFTDQRRMALSAERTATGFIDGIRQAFRTKRPPLAGKDELSIIAIAAVVIALIFLRRLSHRKWRAKAGGFYFDMLKALSAKGLVKRPDETPKEFSERVGDTRVADITEAFERERYAGRKTPGPELERIRRAVRELKKG